MADVKGKGGLVVVGGGKGKGKGPPTPPPENVTFTVTMSLVDAQNLFIALSNAINQAAVKGQKKASGGGKGKGK